MRYYLIYAYIVLSIFTFQPKVYADFYTYGDEKGTIHFTNDIKRVPEQFRKKMKVIIEGSEVREKLIDGSYVIDDAVLKMAEVRVEAEKLWWKWIVDPRSGKTRAPAILGGYILIALVTIVLIRNSISGRGYKLLMKYLFLGFIAIGALTYSAHRANEAYQKLKVSGIDKILTSAGPSKK